MLLLHLFQRHCVVLSVIGRLSYFLTYTQSLSTPPTNPLLFLHLFQRHRVVLPVIARLSCLLTYTQFKYTDNKPVIPDAVSPTLSCCCTRPTAA